MAVFLEPIDAAPAPPIASAPFVVRSGARGFVPEMLAVAAGQSIRFTNDGPIYHRIFSYSESNRFELELLRRGDEQTLLLRRAGVVPVYCSLHPAERLVLFVAPSPYFAAFVPPAAYEIRDVPPGRYRLHALSEHLETRARAVTVRPGSITAGEIAARPRGARP